MSHGSVEVHETEVHETGGGFGISNIRQCFMNFVRFICREQPVVHEAAIRRMAQMPGYTQTGDADNMRVFHGREVRKVPTAAGGHGFVLQLSHAGEDPQGWTPQERAEYDGWGHDRFLVLNYFDRINMNCHCFIR
jgi:hypothetical protein